MAGVFVEVPECCQVQTVFQQESQFIENSLYFTHTGGFTEANMATLAGVVKSWWLANVQPLITDRCNFVKIIATNLASQTAPGIEYVTGLPQHGSISGNDAPLNVTVSIKLLTGLRGRSYRGRNYLCGIRGDKVVHSVLDATYAASLSTAYFNLIAAASAESFIWSVVSRFHNKAPRALGVANAITAVAVDLNSDSQRRRLIGRGR